MVKDWDTVRTHLALIFPDIYDISISNLGVQILYDLVNQRPDALAERAYAPWTDMETRMRQDGIPLAFSNTSVPIGESRTVSTIAVMSLSVKTILA